MSISGHSKKNNLKKVNHCPLYKYMEYDHLWVVFIASLPGNPRISILFYDAEGIDGYIKERSSKGIRATLVHSHVCCYLPLLFSSYAGCYTYNGTLL